MDPSLFLGVLVDSILLGYALGAALTYYFPFGFKRYKRPSFTYTIKPICGELAYKCRVR